MQTPTDLRAIRTVIGIGAVALLALASVAGAMQEYEELKVLLAETEMSVQKVNQQVCDLEDLCILPFFLGTGQLSETLAEVDRLEGQARWAISAAGADAAADFEVRKQMQKIKQAAQEVRNLVLEIRAMLAPATTFPPYLPMWQHGGWPTI